MVISIADFSPRVSFEGLFSFYLLLKGSAACYTRVMKPIVQNGDPVLRERAHVVPGELFGTPALRQMLKDMSEALDAEKDGVALAAPQIGLPYRIFIARFDRLVPDVPKGTVLPADEGIFINPVFVKSSRRRIEMDEGCLSVRAIYGKTLRHERATVEAYDESGKKYSRGGGGILAQIFQHEIDHLNGILFIDHAHELVEVRRTTTDEGKILVEEVPIDEVAAQLPTANVAAPVSIAEEAVPIDHEFHI